MEVEKNSCISQKVINDTQKVDWCHKLSYNVGRGHIKLLYCICCPHLMLHVKNNFAMRTNLKNE